jgi:hypothetical protein
MQGSIEAVPYAGGGGDLVQKPFALIEVEDKRAGGLQFHAFVGDYQAAGGDVGAFYLIIHISVDGRAQIGRLQKEGGDFRGRLGGGGEAGPGDAICQKDNNDAGDKTTQHKNDPFLVPEEQAEGTKSAYSALES